MLWYVKMCVKIKNKVAIWYYCEFYTFSSSNMNVITFHFENDFNLKIRKEERNERKSFCINGRNYEVFLLNIYFKRFMGSKLKRRLLQLPYFN